MGQGAVLLMDTPLPSRLRKYMFGGDLLGAGGVRGQGVEGGEKVARQHSPAPAS